MAWFKLGKKEVNLHEDAPVESVEALRNRAKYRLIGSVALVAAGVVGLPMLFDSQPRTVAVDIPIEIPDKAKTRPLTIAPPAPAPAPSAVVEDKVSLSGKEEIVTPGRAAEKDAKTPAAQSPTAQAATKNIATGAAAATAAAAAVKANADKAKAAEADKAKAAQEAKRAKALLEGEAAQAKPAAPAAAASASANPPGTRYIVQFGAFSESAKAQEARVKVEKAGLKTYSQIAKTPEGERIRVRVGPFASQAEADKAAAKIKALDLPAAILTL
jgi:DedD protein